MAYTRYVYGPNYLGTFAGGYSARHIIYDRMGRAVKQSNPIETNGSWVPAGDDEAGWLYMQQSYDWKGRPLITTNTDGTTKEASYSGCGCAGGEVVTLTDEGTIDAGVTKRRQQKIYSDVLGRTVKTEVLNWQGGTVYSTTVNAYNARDQVKSVRQYQGSESSGIYQETAITYDGYARLKTRHVPEQNAGTATTWDYNLDDTVQKVTDARGSVANYIYNSRRLVTSITYDPSSGVTDTPNVSFEYDAVGNRKLMTDGLGSVSYNYNQLSQLSSESRMFNSVGTFTLSYSYNLAGELTSLTDHFGAQVGYNHDVAGRLNSVTGSGFAGVSTYASGIQYRASGGLKSLNYSDGRSQALSYNARLQLASYSVPGVAGAEYRYSTLTGGTDNDGVVKFVRDTMQPNSPFDCAYRYDHAARLEWAATASLSRGGGYEQTGPYQKGFSYDAFGNLTNHGGLAWSRRANCRDMARVTWGAHTYSLSERPSKRSTDH